MGDVPRPTVPNSADAASYKKGVPVPTGQEYLG